MSNRISQNLVANTPLTIQRGGRLFLLEDAGPAAAVDIVFASNGVPQRRFNGVRAGFRVYLPDSVAPFTSVQIQSTSAGVVTFYLDSEDVQISQTQNVQVTNSVGAPVPVVETVGGPINAGANVVGHSHDVGVAAVLVGGGYTNYKFFAYKARITNTAVINLGSVAVTMALGYGLSPGDSLILPSGQASAGVYAIAAAAAQKLDVFYTNN